MKRKKKNPKQADEIILWATRKGDEAWQEELITAAPNTPEGREKIKKARAWAKSEGFDRFRESGFTMGEIPPLLMQRRSGKTARKRYNPSSSSPRVYVGTYAKYNDGSIKGKWLDLSDYADHDEFMEAARQVHADERDPELMFQDFEGFPKAYYGESHIKPELWDWIALSDDEKEVFEAYQDAVGAEYATIDEAQEKLLGVADSKEDWVMNYIDDIGGLEALGEQAAHYIYVDKVTARQIGIDEAESRIDDIPTSDLVADAGAEEEWGALSNAETTKQELEDLEGQEDDMDPEEFEDKKSALEQQLEEYESLIGGRTEEQILDEIKEQVASIIVDEIEQKVYDDPVGYFVDELGAYSIEELAKQDFVSFDYEKYVRDVEMSGDVVFGEAGGKVYAFSGH